MNHKTHLNAQLILIQHLKEHSVIFATLVVCLQRMWLDILDETKRKKAALDSQRKEAAQQAAKDRQSAASFDPSNR